MKARRISGSSYKSRMARCSSELLVGQRLRDGFAVSLQGGTSSLGRESQRSRPSPDRHRSVCALWEVGFRWNWRLFPKQDCPKHFSILTNACGLRLAGSARQKDPFSVSAANEEHTLSAAKTGVSGASCHIAVFDFPRASAALFATTQCDSRSGFIAD